MDRKLSTVTLRKLLEQGAQFVKHPVHLSGHWHKFLEEGDFLVDEVTGAIGGIPLDLLDTEGWEKK